MRQYLSGERLDVDQSRAAVRRLAGRVYGRVLVVTVRYWASARAAAGRSEDLVCGSSVADVLDAVRRLHGENPALLRVLGVSSLLLGDLPLGSRDLSAIPVRDGDVVEVLPPFAGG